MYRKLPLSEFEKELEVLCRKHNVILWCFNELDDPYVRVAEADEEHILSAGIDEHGRRIYFGEKSIFGERERKWKLREFKIDENTTLEAFREQKNQPVPLPIAQLIDRIQWM